MSATIIQRLQESVLAPLKTRNHLLGRAKQLLARLG